MVSVWPLSVFVSGLFAAPPVVLEGSSDCPSTEAVSRELERIVAAPTGTAPTDRALVALEGAELRILLTTHDGKPLGERRLPADGTCAERALSAAVVLAAWITDAHPEYLSRLPQAQSEPPPASAEPSPPSPPPIPAPAPAKPAPVTPSPSPTPAIPEKPTTAWRFVVAVGVGGEISDVGLVPAGDVSFRYAPEASGFGLSAFALVAGSETRAVGTGEVSSFRWPLGVGGLARLAGDAVALELDAGAMLGLLRVDGRGFTTNDGATDVQGGGYAGVRAVAASGRLRPFAAAKLLMWLGKVTAQASLPESEVDLPAAEGVFLVGLGYAL